MEPLVGSIEATRLTPDARFTSPFSVAVRSWCEHSAGRTAPPAELRPADFVEGLVVLGLESNDGMGPPLRQGKPSPFVSPELMSDTFLASSFPKMPQIDRLILAAGLLQLHDHWNASHEAAQKADDLGDRGLSARWHAVCHRREPDPGNAGYWLARAGHNTDGDRLAHGIASASIDLKPEVRAVSARLVRDGSFDDRAMVAACCSAREGTAVATFLRGLQKLEMAFLIARSLDRLDTM